MILWVCVFAPATQVTRAQRDTRLRPRHSSLSRRTQSQPDEYLRISDGRNPHAAHQPPRSRQTLGLAQRHRHGRIADRASRHHRVAGADRRRPRPAAAPDRQPVAQRRIPGLDRCRRPRVRPVHPAQRPLRHAASTQSRLRAVTDRQLRDGHRGVHRQAHHRGSRVASPAGPTPATGGDGCPGRDTRPAELRRTVRTAALARCVARHRPATGTACGHHPHRRPARHPRARPGHRHRERAWRTGRTGRRVGAHAGGGRQRSRPLHRARHVRPTRRLRHGSHRDRRPAGTDRSYTGAVRVRGQGRRVTHGPRAVRGRPRTVARHVDPACAARQSGQRAMGARCPRRCPRHRPADGPRCSAHQNTAHRAHPG